MKDDRFRPDAAARRVMPSDPARMSGNRADRVIVDDPRAGEALFEPTKPLASVGRNSIPKSHRGEGVNYVD